MFFFRSLVFLLAFGPLVVLAKSFKFSFDHAVEQCEPVFVAFFNTESIDNDHPPTSLTILPFNSTVFSLPLPANSADSTGMSISFLPFASGTQFIASIDDVTGENVAKTSDVTRILESPSNNSACLSPSNDPTPVFKLPTSVSQCEEFAISYTGSQAPTVRIVRPQKGSSLAAQVSDDTANKTARYTMAEDHGSEVVVFAFDEELKQGQTSALLTVEGDSSSPNACHRQNAIGDDDNNILAVSGGLSKNVIIGLSVGGGIILLMAAVMAAYILRLRQRKKQKESSHVTFRPALFTQENRSRESVVDQGSKRGEPTASPFTVPSYMEYGSDVVQNPVYASQFYSPSANSFVMVSNRGSTNGSAISRGSVPPPPLRHQESTNSAPSDSRPRESRHDSLYPNDIENMLIAASHINRQSDLARTDIQFEYGTKQSESRVSPVPGTNEASPAHLSKASVTSSTEMYQDLFTRPSPTPTPIPTLGVSLQSRFSTPSSISNTARSIRDSDPGYAESGQNR